MEAKFSRGDRVLISRTESEKAGGRKRMGMVLDFYLIDLNNKTFRRRSNGQFFRYLISYEDWRGKDTEGEFWEDELQTNNQ